MTSQIITISEVPLRLFVSLFHFYCFASLLYYLCLKQAAVFLGKGKETLNKLAEHQTAQTCFCSCMSNICFANWLFTSGSVSLHFIVSCLRRAGSVVNSDEAVCSRFDWDNICMCPWRCWGHFVFWLHLCKCIKVWLGLRMWVSYDQLKCLCETFTTSICWCEPPLTKWWVKNCLFAYRWKALKRDLKELRIHLISCLINKDYLVLWLHWHPTRHET